MGWKVIKSGGGGSGSSHTHGNLLVLDGLGDNVGNLTYKGSPLKVESISATNVIETSSKQFVSASEKAQVTAHETEINSHSSRLASLESASTGVSTDELVKLTAGDSAGYLADKIDADTIQLNGDRLSAVSLQGMIATLTEINYLAGVTNNVQAQINALTNIGNFTTTVDTHSELATILNPSPTDMIIVLSDEMQTGGSSIYIFNGTDWTFAGEFKGGEIRDFLAKPISLETESSGILPKTRYEKQNAAETEVLDAANNFQSSNLEDVLAELFTFANSFKTSVATSIGNPLLPSDTRIAMIDKINMLKGALASAITGKGVPAYSYNTILEMANKISSIPNISIPGLVKRTSKLNVVAPYTHQIVLSESLSLSDITTTVLEYTGANSGVVHYEANYNNGESSSFSYDDSIVDFDGFMKIKDNWSYLLNESADGSYFESEEIDFSAYHDLVSLDRGLGSIKITGIQSQRAVVQANDDISLFGVDTLDSANLIANVSGNGVNKLVVSFDNGVIWQAYDGSVWVTVDINNLDDFASKGMTRNTLYGMSDKEFSVARSESNFLRFAYYLERPTYEDVAENDSIQLYVTMKGYDTIAHTSKYTYDYNPATKTITFEFLANGTFTMNYVDGN